VVPSNVAAPSWSRARARALAPAGATEVRLCRYHLGPALATSLAASRLVRTPALVAKIVSAFDALPPKPRTIGSSRFACPDSYTGRFELALLSYPHGKRLSIEVQRSPVTCQTATNASIVRLANRPGDAMAGRRLLALLARLTV
jgi:hypothetical protein